MEWLLYLAFLIFKAVIGQDFLDEKAKLMVAMMDTDVDPCEDFFSYANGNFDGVYAREMKLKNLAGPLTDPSYSRGFESIDALRRLYVQCKAGNAPKNEITFQQKIDMATNKLAGIALPMQKTDENVKSYPAYLEVLSKIYSLLFEVGHPLFDKLGKEMATTVFVFHIPEEWLHPEESKAVWDAYCAKVPCSSRVTYREGQYTYDLKTLRPENAQEFANIVFGVTMPMSNMSVRVHDVRTTNDTDVVYNSRAALINQLIEAFMQQFDAKYNSCEELIQKYFPLHLAKMTIDPMRRNNKIAIYEDYFFTMADMILHEAGRMVNETKQIPVNLKKIMMDKWKKNTFAFLEFPLFDDDLFRKYFDKIDVTKIYSKRLTNTYRALFNFHREQGGKMEYVASVYGDNAFHVFDTFVNFFDWGALRYPFFDPTWPAYLTYSTGGFIMAHEAGHTFAPMYEGSIEYTLVKLCIIRLYSNICVKKKYSVCLDPARTLNENMADQFGLPWAFNAYKRLNLHQDVGVQPKSAILRQFTDDQLFFINMAQWRAQSKGWDFYDPNKHVHAPSEVRISQSLGNFPGFSNAFNCPLGSKYNIKNKCQMLNNNPSYDKDIYAKYTTRRR